MVARVEAETPHLRGNEAKNYTVDWKGVPHDWLRTCCLQSQAIASIGIGIASADVNWLTRADRSTISR